MWIKEILWIERFVSKIRQKHNIAIEEVEEALNPSALFRRVKRGRVSGEDVYQTTIKFSSLDRLSRYNSAQSPVFSGMSIKQPE